MVVREGGSGRPVFVVAVDLAWAETDSDGPAGLLQHISTEGPLDASLDKVLHIVSPHHCRTHDGRWSGQRVRGTWVPVRVCLWGRKGHDP